MEGRKRKMTYKGLKKREKIGKTNIKIIDNKSNTQNNGISKARQKERQTQIENIIKQTR